MKFRFNPFTAQFEYVIPSLTRGQVVTSILVTHVVDPTTGEMTVGIIFDEDSILYADDEFNA